MRLFIPLFGVMVAGCVSSTGSKLSGEQKALCRGENPNVDVAPADCFEYGRVTKIRGVWYYGFEESHFEVGTGRINRALVKDGKSKRDPWLLVDETAVLGKVANPRHRPGCAMAIYLEIDGRYSIRSIPHGVTAAFDVVKVERLRDASFLGYARLLNTELSTDCAQAER